MGPTCFCCCIAILSNHSNSYAIWTAQAVCSMLGWRLCREMALHFIITYSPISTGETALSTKIQKKSPLTAMILDPLRSKDCGLERRFRPEIPHPHPWWAQLSLGRHGLSHQEETMRKVCEILLIRFYNFTDSLQKAFILPSLITSPSHTHPCPPSLRSSALQGRGVGRRTVLLPSSLLWRAELRRLLSSVLGAYVVAAVLRLRWL